MCNYDVISLTDPAASSISVLIFNGISEANTVFSIPNDLNRWHIYQNQLLNHSKATPLNQTVCPNSSCGDVWSFHAARLHPGLLRQPRATAVNVTSPWCGAVLAALRCCQCVSSTLALHASRFLCTVYERAHGRDVSILSAFINYP